VYQWLEGENPTFEQLVAPEQAATDLAQFLLALQRIDTTDGPLALEQGLRGVRLALRDGATRQAIAAMNDMINTELVTEVWEAALAAPQWDRAPVWFHGDMLAGNVLMNEGRLSAVIDFSGLGVGDPACDYMIAWDLFRGASRERFRNTLAIDAATWVRARGHVVSQAVQFIVYYQDTNPGGVKNAWRRLNAALHEYSAGGHRGRL
jgi:aminoglycoside phosphotransferase (APT) family kinase protein